MPETPPGENVTEPAPADGHAPLSWTWTMVEPPPASAPLPPALSPAEVPMTDHLTGPPTALMDISQAPSGWEMSQEPGTSRPVVGLVRVGVDEIGRAHV